jgi:hypothetical protein
VGICKHINLPSDKAIDSSPLLHGTSRTWKNRRNQCPTLSMTHSFYGSVYFHKRVHRNQTPPAYELVRVPGSRLAWDCTSLFRDKKTGCSSSIK